MINSNLMNHSALRGQPFRVEFNEKTIYTDPDYGMLEIICNGYAEVSSNDRAGDVGAMNMVRAIIATEIRNGLSTSGGTPISYTRLQERTGVLRSGAENALRAKGFTLSQFAITSMAPSESAKHLIELRDRQKQIQAMSPEELAKRMEEATRQAQAAMDALTPDERMRAQAEAKRKMAEDMARMQTTIDQARAISAAAKQNAPQPGAVAAAAATTAASASPVAPNPAGRPMGCDASGTTDRTERAGLLPELRSEDKRYPLLRCLRREAGIESFNCTDNKPMCGRR